MFTDSDYDKLRQIMLESKDNELLIQKLLDSHRQTIGTISHEIRNPLTLIYSTLQLIEAQHPEVIGYKYWCSMVEDVEYMKHLLEELSAFNNSSTLSLCSLDFGSFMEQLVLSFAVTFVDSTAEFTSYVEPCLPTIPGDRIKLKEVFLNLLRNAAEAVGADGVIKLSASRSGTEVIVTITDNGCGIAPDKLDDIFTPFVTYKQGGTGLGLAIAKQTVEAHKGHISLTSIPGHGSAFTIALPIQQKT